MKYAIYMRYHRAYVSNKPQNMAGLVLPEFWRIRELESLDRFVNIDRKDIAVNPHERKAG